MFVSKEGQAQTVLQKPRCCSHALGSSARAVMLHDASKMEIKDA